MGHDIMTYKDKDKQRKTTRERVKRHRAKKGVTEDVTTKPDALICPDNMGKSPEELRELTHKIIEGVTIDTAEIKTQEDVNKAASQMIEANNPPCPLCGGRGFTEEQHGLIQRQCECQRDARA